MAEDSSAPRPRYHGDVAHTIVGWQPGATVRLFRASQEEPQRVAQAPPRSSPLATASADARGSVTFAAVPANFPLLAYGARADARAAWLMTSAHPYWELKPDYSPRHWASPGGYPTR
jgi:hypothetical protein